VYSQGWYSRTTRDTLKKDVEVNQIVLIALLVDDDDNYRLESTSVEVRRSLAGVITATVHLVVVSGQVVEIDAIWRLLKIHLS
jgi:hypothetical protein